MMMIMMIMMVRVRVRVSLSAGLFLPIGAANFYEERDCNDEKQEQRL